MSPDGVLPDEMGRSTYRRELDPLDVKVDAPADLATFAEDLRFAHPEIPVPQERAQRHMLAIATAASLLADEGMPASHTHGPDGRVPGLQRRRRTIVRMPVLKTLRAKIVVAVTVALTSFGGLAVAGALPGPLQGAAAGAAGLVGISLPDGDDDQGEVLDDDQGDANDDDLGDVEDEGDQGDDADDQGDEDQGDVEDDGDQGEDADDQGDVNDDDQGAVDDQGDQGEEADDQGVGTDDDPGGESEDADGSDDVNEDDGEDQGTVDDESDGEGDGEQ